MAFRTILRIGSEKRELLTFSVRYFEAKNEHFPTDSERDSIDSIDDLYRAAKADPHAFRPARGLPYGGLLELTMLSTANDDWLYEWMVPSKLRGIMIKHGVIEFYNDDDDYIPFKRIEFWDAWVADISESMSCTGNMPMTLCMRISPATVRYNKLLVVQKDWWQTDINEAESKTEEESELFVTDIKWRGRKDNYISAVERKDMMLNHNITLEVEVRDYAEGESFELTVRQSKGRRIKGNSTEFTIQGTVNDSNIVLIENFKVECDFKDDNQDFGNIEFYHNERKIAEFKENFGWTYVKDGDVTRVFVNVELETKAMPRNISIEEAKEAIKSCFTRTLENSWKNKFTGKVFFNGSSSLELPQYVPKVTIIRGSTGNGNIIMGKITTEIEATEDDYLEELSITVIHELFHSVRLEHPFDKTQSEDTKLFNDGYRRYGTYIGQTDPNISYNIMFYNIVHIDGILLKKLWKTKSPEYLTKGQLLLVLKEIDMQQQGAGTISEMLASELPISDAELDVIRENNIDLGAWLARDWYWTEGSYGKKMKAHRDKEGQGKSQ